MALKASLHHIGQVMQRMPNEDLVTFMTCAFYGGMVLVYISLGLLRAIQLISKPGRYTSLSTNLHPLLFVLLSTLSALAYLALHASVFWLQASSSQDPSSIPNDRRLTQIYASADFSDSASDLFLLCAFLTVIIARRRDFLKDVMSLPQAQSPTFKLTRKAKSTLYQHCFAITALAWTVTLQGVSMVCYVRSSDVESMTTGHCRKPNGALYRWSMYATLCVFLYSGLRVAASALKLRGSRWDTWDKKALHPTLLILPTLIYIRTLMSAPTGFPVTPPDPAVNPSPRWHVPSDATIFVRAFCLITIYSLLLSKSFIRAPAPGLEEEGGLGLSIVTRAQARAEVEEDMVDVSGVGGGEDDDDREEGSSGAGRIALPMAPVSEKADLQGDAYMPSRPSEETKRLLV